MLQVLYLDVSKVDPVLHIRYAWEAGGGASAVRGTFGRRGPCVGAGDAGAVEQRLGDMGPCVDTRNEGEIDCSSGHLVVWTLGVLFYI